MLLLPVQPEPHKPETLNRVHNKHRKDFADGRLEFEIVRLTKRSGGQTLFM